MSLSKLAEHIAVNKIALLYMYVNKIGLKYG